MNLIKVVNNLFQFNRTNWKAVALCFLAAAIFWLFNAFNKTYSTDISFPLRFDYNTEAYAPIGQLPDRVKINVSGNGWDLFRKRSGIRKPELVIALERPTDVKKIVGSTLPVLFNDQLGGLRINHIVTDTLRLDIDDRDSHRFKLYADLSQVQFIEGYGRISALVFLPDTVELQGPQKLLHQLPDSLFIQLPKVILDNSYREELEVTVPFGESLTRNPPVVTVMFEVGPVEMVEKKIPVQVLSLPSGIQSGRVDSITLVVQIPRNLHDDFQSRIDQVVARIDLKGKARGTYHVVPEVVGLPNYAEVLAYDSLKVQF